jgi:hypothetical protein
LERTRWDPNSFSYGYTNYEANQYEGSGKQFIENLSRGFFFIQYFNRIPNAWISRLRFDSTAAISFSITMKYALRYLNKNNTIEGDLFHGKPIAGVNLRYVVFENIFIESTVLYYLIPETQLDFDPDFTYSFGYNSYKHLTIAFSYGNYAVNRFYWRETKIKNHGFLDGQFSLVLNYSW